MADAPQGPTRGRPGTGPRVVHLSTVHHDLDNRIVNKECRALAEAGFDIHLVISAEADRTEGGVQVHALRRRSRLTRLVFSQAQAWRTLRQVRPDVLHVHDPELIPLAVRWKRRHGSAIIYDAHENLVEQVSTKDYLGPISRRLAARYARWLLRLADRHCDAVVTVTEAIAADFRADAERPVVVVRNLPWLADFPLADVAANDQVAVYTGDLSRARGLDRMVAAVQAVPGTTLVMAGRTFDSVTEQPGVQHLGLVHPSQLADVIGRGRVGLALLDRSPNYENSLPTKVFEYMACGLPFLATDLRAWQELFGGHDAGLFVDIDDPDAVRAALASLVTDPERCAAMGARGRALVEERFSFEGEARALVALVNQLAGR